MNASLGIALLSLFQPQVEAKLPQSGQAVIPAERIGNYLKVKAIVNGKPLCLIVDSGAGLNVLTPNAAKIAGIEGGQTVQASGAGAGITQARIVTVKEFRLNDAIVKNDTAVVLELPKVLNCDGLVGYSFLRHFATTFDYDTNTLTVRPSGSYKPSPDEVEGKLRVRNNHPQVAGQIAGESGWMVIDTGNNGTTSILKWLVEKGNLVKNWPVSEEYIVGKGTGGQIKGYAAVSPGFEISGVSIPKGQVTLDSSGVGAFADKDILANVGAEHIRRFRMTLDYIAQKAYFGKSKAYNSPLRVDRSGLRIDSMLDKQIVVGVVKGSPGDQAGVKVGDTVLEIDGKRAEETEPLLFGNNLRQPAGILVRLKISREGKVFDTTFKLEDLIK
jgi:Aspartyl protease/PDZ domain